MVRMQRFVSHFTNRLDAKGRVSIPASFRAVLQRDGFEGLYIHPGLEGPTLDCGGHALLEEIDGLLSRFSPYSPERDTFAVALLGTSEVLKLDGEGRIILSEGLKSFAGIGTEITFVGVGHKFQIWEPAAFKAHLGQASEALRALRLSLGTQTLGVQGGTVAGEGKRK